MTAQFPVFAAAVRARFDEIAKERLYLVDTSGDRLWEEYINAFPLGANPLFRKRSEHDCSCCRHFIRDIGPVVGIQNGAVASVWDLNGLPSPYQEVADAMSAYVKSYRIVDVFLTKFAKVGTSVSHGLINGAAITFHHFAVDLPRLHVDADWVARRGKLREAHEMLCRAVVELKPEAVATVRDLIEANSLYRGEEHLRAVLEFQQLQQRTLAALESAPGQKEVATWPMIDSRSARFRNTVIGTLVRDLSDGVDLEKAVRSFESKVAPQNYKRPTALITKKMVDAAMKTIAELGLEAALQRRHARFSDVSVNSVLFVDNSVRGEMKGGIKGLLMEEVRPPPFDPKRATEIGIDDFIATVLPKTTGLRLYLEGRHLGNFVSLTAPVHEDSKSLFRWGNDFAWSYDGNAADSIKERVKRAGGQVEGVAMRVSLSWSNYDDLDLHVIGPDGQDHIYYAAKSGSTGRSGGQLDVDMNAGTGTTREPVENVRWVRTPRDGLYNVFVHQFFKRESVDVGFTVEVEAADGVETFRYDKALPQKAEQAVVEITRKGGAAVLRPAGGITAGAATQEKWGIKTLDLARVDSVVLSPNHWDERVGNKHWFFILEGCHNPLPTRGIYNEFLHPRLEQHRKVFEVLGDKVKCAPADKQLSGVGFSSTRKDKVTVIAMGPSLQKAYTIVFG